MSALPKNFKEGHLQGAFNIPRDQIVDCIKSVSPIKRTQPSTAAAAAAEAALTELKKPATNVTNHGGYEDLVKKKV